MDVWIICSRYHIRNIFEFGIVGGMQKGCIIWIPFEPQHSINIKTGCVKELAERYISLVM